VSKLSITLKKVQAVDTNVIFGFGKSRRPPCLELNNHGNGYGTGHGGTVHYDIPQTTEGYGRAAGFGYATRGEGEGFPCNYRELEPPVSNI